MMLPLARRDLPSDTVPYDTTTTPPQALAAPLAAHTDYDLHRSLPIESLEHYIECRLADERFRVS
ncbi:MAG: hypothetical protein EPN68_12305 [Rhodanobacter sp.]|nr:MAG: hypothetical protein EPN68_12305 [Rhodanobacter sp.]